MKIANQISCEKKKKGSLGLSSEDVERLYEGLEFDIDIDIVRYYSYLDSIAKSQNLNIHNSNKYIFKKIINSLLSCSHSFLRFICTFCRTDYAMQLLCNREYCSNPICQKEALKRRKARAFRRFVGLGSKIGYTVFTLPKDISCFINQDTLRELRNYLRDKLKRMYGKEFKALVRWHWFGDGFYRCEKKSGKCKFREKLYNHNYPICNNFFKKCKYKKKIKIEFFPHLNLISNIKFIEERELEELKKGWKDKVNRLFGCEYKKIIVNHEFATKRNQRLHIFNYVYRNTFRILEGYENLACMLSGFRNNVAWGKFETDRGYILEKSIDLYGRKKVEEIADPKLLELMEGYCIICGKRKLRYYKQFDYNIDKSRDWKHLGLGYYFFPCGKSENIV